MPARACMPSTSPTIADGRSTGRRSTGGTIRRRTIHRIRRRPLVAVAATLVVVVVFAVVILVRRPAAFFSSWARLRRRRLCALGRRSVGGFEIASASAPSQTCPWRRPFLCSCSRRAVVALVGSRRRRPCHIAPPPPLSESPPPRCLCCCCSIRRHADATFAAADGCPLAGSANVPSRGSRARVVTARRLVVRWPTVGADRSSSRWRP